jgi:hypothetical protein
MPQIKGAGQSHQVLEKAYEIPMNVSISIFCIKKKT